MTELCTLDEIADPGSKGPFVVDGVALFLVRKDGEVFAYVNSCPHVGAPLHMEEDDFLDLDDGVIRCTVHGARFEIETGACLLGPCRNKKLSPYAVTVRNGKVIAEPSTIGV